MLLLCCCLGLAYLHAGYLPLVLVGCTLTRAGFLQVRAVQLRFIDWAVLLIILLEGASPLSSRYTPSGVSTLKVVAISSLFYFLARMTPTTPTQYLIGSLLIAVCGVVLAGSAVFQFHEHFRELL